jgi:2-C-methyl-D-erythritol 2,4-cyclodiphosphate synthase
MNYRIGFGYDVHQLAEGRQLILGGITVHSEKGCVAHSDGDVLLHALCDALLGAANLGDIGKHFPDTDPKYKNIASTILLQEVLDLIKNNGYQLVNVDSTICLQYPRLGEFKEQIQKKLQDLLGVEHVSIKATSTEKMGFVGEGKGISAYSVVLLEKIL